MAGSGDVEQTKILDACTDCWIVMRPEGIRACTGGGHPVLLLREVDGSRGVTVRIDEAEARDLASEFEGTRRRRSRTYETFEEIVTGLGGSVNALRLVGDKHRGLSGDIEVVSGGRQVRARAHPGDVAALARRLMLTVLVPTEVARREPDGPDRLQEWHPRKPSAGRHETRDASGQLPEPRPEDYDW